MSYITSYSSFSGVPQGSLLGLFTLSILFINSVYTEVYTAWLLPNSPLDNSWLGLPLGSWRGFLCPQTPIEIPFSGGRVWASCEGKTNATIYRPSRVRLNKACHCKLLANALSEMLCNINVLICYGGLTK